MVGSRDVFFHSTTTVTSASSHYRWCCLFALAVASCTFYYIIKSFLRVATVASSLIVVFLVRSGFIKVQLQLFILRWSCFLVRSGLLQVQKELFKFFPPSSYGSRASRFYYRKQSFVAIIHFLFLLKAVPSPTLVESKLVYQSWGVWASSRSPWLLSKCSFFYITVVRALQLLLHRRLFYATATGNDIILDMFHCFCFFFCLCCAICHFSFFFLCVEKEIKIIQN